MYTTEQTITWTPVEKYPGPEKNDRGVILAYTFGDSDIVVEEHAYMVDGHWHTNDGVWIHPPYWKPLAWIPMPRYTVV